MLFLRIIKITVFAVSFLIASRVILFIVKKRNPQAVFSDPEIIAIAVIFAALLTTIVSLILKTFI